MCCYEYVLPQSKININYGGEGKGKEGKIYFKILTNPGTAGAATDMLIMKLRCAKMRWGNTLEFPLCVSRRDLSCTIEIRK